MAISSYDRLEDFSIYSSGVPPVDSLHFELSIEEVLVDETRFLERGLFHLFVHTTIPSEVQRPLLKWDVEHVFLISEIVCSPLQAPKSCYVTRPINENDVCILDGSTLDRGSAFSEYLVKQDIDFRRSSGRYTRKYFLRIRP